MFYPLDGLERSVGYKLLVSGVFSASNLSVKTTPNAMMVSPETDRKIKRSAVKAYHDLVRLEGWTLCQDGDLQLRVGKTDYKEYVATRDLGVPTADSWQQTSNPLAVCAMILTADDRLFMIRRSEVVDAYKGFLHVPASGFVKIPRDLRANGTPDVFSALQNEAREEIGPEVNLIDVQCLGLAYDLKLCHPELIFQCTTTLTHEGLERCIQESASKESEVSSAIGLKPDGISLMDFLLGNFQRYVPTGFACAARWGENRYGVDWLRKLESLVRGSV